MQLQIKLWNTDLHSMNLKPLDKLICRVGITKESTPITEWGTEWDWRVTISILALISFFSYAAWGSRGQQNNGSRYCLEDPCAGMNKIIFLFF